MTLSRWSFRTAVALLVLTWGLSSQAAIYQKDPVDGYTCADNMTTDGCFKDPTVTTFSGPDPVACVAIGPNQRCRDCVDYYLPNGQPSGTQVCGYVKASESCSCKSTTRGCVMVGSCSYS